MLVAISLKQGKQQAPATQAGLTDVIDVVAKQITKPITRNRVETLAQHQQAASTWTTSSMPDISSPRAATSVATSTSNLASRNDLSVTWLAQRARQLHDMSHTWRGNG